MSERKPCPSDLSDERWALIEPVITAWKAAHPSVSGHQGSYAMREIVNAIFYQGRTGCQRDYLPHDLPPRSAGYCYFARWRDDGTDQAIHDLLRWQAREQHGRLADPSLVVLDTQSVQSNTRPIRQPPWPARNGARSLPNAAYQAATEPDRSGEITQTAEGWPFTSTEVVYGVTGTEVTELPEYGVSP